MIGVDALVREGQRLADAIRWAAAQHGAPNRFAAGELATLYGAPRATTTGILMTQHLVTINVLLCDSGLSVSYDKGRPSMVVVISTEGT